MKPATPAIQDYLAAIYDLGGSGQTVIGARLAKHMGVSAPTVTEALRRMQRDGYIRVLGRKEIRLISKGQEVAELIARRHRLLERWLTDVLGLDWAEAHDEAHRLEHSLSPKVEERLATLLGRPATCPHGNPIPGMGTAQHPEHIPLSEARVGQEVIVHRITEEAEADRQLLNHLWQNGLRPGSSLEVLDVAPWVGTVTVRLGDRTVVLGLSAAAKVLVRLSVGKAEKRSQHVPGGRRPLGGSVGRNVDRRPMRV